MFQYLRHIAFGGPIPKHQIDRYQCERHGKVPTHAVCSHFFFFNKTNKIKKFIGILLNIGKLNCRSVKNCFIRGSVVRYVQLPSDEVDTQLLQDSARKEAVITSTR